MNGLHSSLNETPSLTPQTEGGASFGIFGLIVLVVLPSFVYFGLVTMQESCRCQMPGFHKS